MNPGFINLKVSEAFLADYLNQVQKDENLSIEKVKEPKTIMIDYGGPNVGKASACGTSAFCNYW